MIIQSVGTVCFSEPQQFCCERCGKVLATVSIAVAIFDAELCSALLSAKDKVLCCGQRLSLPKGYPSEKVADKESKFLMDLLVDGTIPEVHAIAYPLEFMREVLVSTS
jgi:hypothetical protein